jgi:FkbM family methyltransferase
LTEAGVPVARKQTSADGLDNADRGADDSHAERVGFDYVNVLVYHNASKDSIEVLVSVPLLDGAAAETRITLGAPLRLPNQLEKFEYRMNIDTKLSVLPAQNKPTGTVQTEVRDGLKWEIPEGYPGAWTALLEHEPRVRQFLLTHFRPGDVFVDVGANVGAYSLRAGSRGMKVYSFEPNPENAKILMRNAEINNLQVDVRQFALGATEGTARLSPSGATSRIASDGDVGVEMKTLDGFELPRLDLLKVDVEGYELEVLKGSKKTIARCRPVMMVEMHDWLGAQDEAKVFEILTENGYAFEYLDKYAHGRHLAAFPGPAN